MQKLKTAAALLLGLFCICSVLLAVFFFSRSDEDYRRLLINMVDNLSGYTLSIQGQFMLQRSLTPALTVSDFELRSKSGSDKIRIQRFRLAVDLPALLQGELHINDLLMINARFDLDAGGTLQPWAHFPLPMVAHALLQNVRMSIAGIEVAAIDNLKIQPREKQSVWLVQGQGRYRGRNIDIDGRMGAADERNQRAGNFPVMLAVTAKTGSLMITGYVDEEQKLDLHYTVKHLDAGAILHVATPHALQIYSSGRILGDYRSPGISGFQLTVRQGQTLLLQASGSVGNLLTLEKTTIRLAGSSNDPVFLQWLIPDGWPGFDSGKFTALLETSEKLFHLDEIDVFLSSANALQVKLTGSGVWNTAGPALENLHLTTYLRAPDVAAVYPDLVDLLPLSGKVSGKAQVTGGSDVLSIGDIQLAIAGKGQAQLLAAGKIVLPVDTQDGSEARLSLDLALHAGSTTAVQQFAGMKIPDFGPLVAHGSLQGTLAKLQLQQFELRAGREELLLLKVAGGISFNPGQETALQARVSAPSITQAAQLLDWHLPELGALQASMDIVGAVDKLAVRNMLLQIGDRRSLLLQAKGGIAHISPRDKSVKGVAMAVSMAADSTSTVAGMFAAEKIPDFGPLRGHAQVSGALDNLQVRDLHLSAGREDLLQVTASGKIEQLQPMSAVPLQGVDIAVALSAPDSGSLSNLFFTHPVNLGRLTGTADLRDRRGRLSLQAIQLLAGDRQQPILEMQGKITDLFGQRKTRLRMDFDQRLLARIFDKEELPDSAAVTGQLSISTAKDAVGTQELSIAEKDTDLLDVKITGGMEAIQKGAGIQFHGSLTVRDLARLGGLFAVTLPDLGQVSAAGEFLGSRKQVEFRGKITRGKNQFNVDLAMSLAGKKPRITGSISAGSIDVADLGHRAVQNTDSTVAGKGPVFSRKRLPLAILKALDLDLDLVFTKVFGEKSTIDRLESKVVLEDGKLHVGPAGFFFSGGDMNIDVEIDARKLPIYAFKMYGRNIEIGNILGQFQQPPAIEGRQNYAIQLGSKGYSAHEIAANLQGDISVVLENGKVRRRKLDVLFLHLFDWLFTYGLGRNDFLITCGISRFKVSQGVAKIATLYWDGPKLRVMAKGEIDLGREKLQVLVNLRKKGFLVDTDKPIELTGSLRDPDVDLLQLDQSLLKAGGYIFAPVFMLSYDALDSLWDLLPEGKHQSGGCQQVLP